MTLNAAPARLTDPMTAVVKAPCLLPGACCPVACPSLDPAPAKGDGRRERHHLGLLDLALGRYDARALGRGPAGGGRARRDDAR